MRYANTPVETAIDDLIARGALFVLNHSAGKDSQAMTLLVRERVPAEQLLLIHAELPGADWDGLVEHITATAGDLPLITCRSIKTFFEMVDHRQMWPSPQLRQCTSDLKRGPLEREIRRYLKANPRFGGLVVNCTGIRAEESASRAKQIPFRFNEGNSKAGREWYDWMPIFDLSETEVYAAVRSRGQEVHWAYLAGMSRLSCRFCVMSSKPDLRTAARLSPAVARAYMAKEREIDQTMLMPVNGVRVFLEDIIGDVVAEAEAAQLAAE